MFCRNCGQQLDDTATVCTNCGHQTGVVAAAKEERVFLCKNCGRQINPEKAFCPYCGAAKGQKVDNPQAQTQAAANTPPVTVNVTNQTTAQPDAPNLGFAFLGFFFPLIGLILWLVWKEQTPLKARSCGKGALIGVIVSVVSYVFIFIVYGVLLSSLASLSVLPALL